MKTSINQEPKPKPNFVPLKLEIEMESEKDFEIVREFLQNASYPKGITYKNEVEALRESLLDELNDWDV